MTNVTTIDAVRATKAARQSVRAKVRKALAVDGADLSQDDIAHLNAVFASLNAALAPAKKAAKKAAKVTAEKTGTSKRKPMSAKDRKAFGAKMKAAKAAKAAERAALAA
jgi:hypothetical protein